MKRKPGRPKKAVADLRDGRIQITCSREGRLAILEAARAAEMPVSHWVEYQAFRKDDGK